MKDKSKIQETSLVHTTGFLIVWFLTKNEVFLYISAFFGVTGVFIKPLATVISKLWFILADILNFIFSRLILGILFFFVLFPVSVVYRLTGTDKLRLKIKKSGTWAERNHLYNPADLRKIW